MNLTVPASIPVLRWAAERARLDDFALVKRFRKWPLWLSGEAQPTLRQIEDFARMTHTPFGYFFLPEPPRMELPVPDFRSLRDAPVREPSNDLLDTVYLCQRRQDWFREYAQLNGLPPVPFVGEVRVGDVPEAVAEKLRDTLDLSVTERQTLPTWTDALRQLIARTEDAGVLVMASSIVGANSHRKLDVDEFRGFALADHLAPLVFLNAGDSKAAQMFSLAHELAHLALGQSGISDAEAGRVPERTTERWCNKVAAELLMPLAVMREAVQREAAIEQEIQRLARLFKVSTLVALRRLFDAGLINAATLWQHYRKEVERLRTLERTGGGGDFYRTLGARTGKRFARALVGSALEGQTLFQDAFRLLGVRKSATFYQAARELGVML
ncbi:ImmA/IrrE family metallo-endopeptidase [Candidatus Accumulibacter phosphatis]|jgi:Zn-dependent peptidase ImmA (M78 family)|uniref:ImmA/IrrE family metallo-endopeptidase n=1 Tax=Candidatus Accumulibacter phosphatis TaxID=327160 RepID=A0ABX1TTT2_9PROT|nr:ImmA/IrrE family metallo-endopeptidase [Candidatus Accumulibacter phosphatis]NMQ27674.1 ImmA/IrrE family metallo-endopeptidase [Candidatus Accumulibacter phosphatis]